MRTGLGGSGGGPVARPPAKAMRRTAAIWILCPQHLRRVRGTYESDPSGEFRYGPRGEFLLDFARCSQDEGRCAETLCALHRFNRRGPGSWYPDRIFAMRPPRQACSPRGEGGDLA